MSVTFRPWREGDEVAAATAFGAPDTPQANLDRPLLGPDAEDPWRRCLVAEIDGQVIGAAAVSEARLHPDRLWVYVEVASDHRRRGIGSELVQRLREVASPSGVGAIRARYTAGNTAAEGFAAALGLTQVHRSRQVMVQPGALDVPVFGPTGPALEDLATGSVELTKLVVAFYDATHASWDRSEMTLGRAQDLLLAPQTGARGAIVLRDRAKSSGGTILAFAVSYDPPVLDPDDPGTVPAVPTSDEAPTQVLLGYDTGLAEERSRAAVRQVLAMLAARYPVQVEVDDAMTPLAAVIDDLLVIGSATIVTETRFVASD
ncbi:GNAT family N-acetyltransferase [Ruania alkalisoli]|uniref:GNAT family N-acetyltransferase n=1 Tax=Ruania alkalisoli TaxID=2779775 RepID=A0A7M1SXE2_9MICO|nr:GNAT family N-acetyltransferase [Ruania alkalisoli]QOR72238.1 GNAT family N-acetyltransferase [Ruania alkalisoli]